MRRIAGFVYGLTCYGVFFVTFLYLIAFLANFMVPKGIDDGANASTLAAALIDIGLIALFGLQHSVMARPAFKRRLARLLPESLERSTYVLASSAALIVLYWQWRPLRESVWSIDSPTWGAALWGLLLAGFGIVFLTSFVIDHFDLFGLRQVWLALARRAYRHPAFRVTHFYRFVRHPLYFGLLLGIWCTPRMTLGHLLFAIGMTAYILVGIRFEERDMETFLGEDYRRYKARVPMLIPNIVKPHEIVKPAAQDAGSRAH